MCRHCISAKDKFVIDELAEVLANALASNPNALDKKSVEKQLADEANTQICQWQKAYRDVWGKEPNRDEYEEYFGDQFGPEYGFDYRQGIA